MTASDQLGREVASIPLAPTSLQPRNLSEAMDLAKALAVSNIIPYTLRGKPADVLVIIMYGMELNLSVNQALRGIHVINGAPSLSAELRVSKTRERGHLVGIACATCMELGNDPAHAKARPGDGPDPGRHPYLPDSDDTACTVKAIRKDTGEIAIVTWTIEMAINAHLVKRAEAGNLVARSKTNEPLPWELYPADMLYNRAAARACKRIAPEVAYGLYTEEELEQMPPERVDVHVGDPIPDGTAGVEPDDAADQVRAMQDEHLGSAS